jgi:ABC-type glycerol-3-phosphate transport system substrate-binding protein
VTYIEKSKRNFNQEILEGLATGNIPDLILVSNEDFMQNLNKLYKMPFGGADAVISKRQYKENYLDAFMIYTQRDGYFGIPFIIDPMVLFYNKILFRNNAILDSPRY